MRADLATAIHHARRIRRNLVRRRGDVDLGGDCGYASVLLADALGSPASLRATDEDMFDGERFHYTPHVWNVIAGVIIDITATQFNDCETCDQAGEPPVFGVLVTPTPRIYHRPVALRGLAVVTEVDSGWYSGRDLRTLQGAIERLRGVP